MITITFFGKEMFGNYAFEECFLVITHDGSQERLWQPVLDYFDIFGGPTLAVINLFRQHETTHIPSDLSEEEFEQVCALLDGEQRAILRTVHLCAQAEDEED